MNGNGTRDGTHVLLEVTKTRERSDSTQHSNTLSVCLGRGFGFSIANVVGGLFFVVEQCTMLCSRLQNSGGFKVLDRDRATLYFTWSRGLTFDWYNKG